MNPQDLKEIKLLNRVVRITETGLAYEADPRHVELMVKSLGLEHCRQYGDAGRNDPCPCGSGKKFKTCHGK